MIQPLFSADGGIEFGPERFRKDDILLGGNASELSPPRDPNEVNISRNF